MVGRAGERCRASGGWGQVVGRAGERCRASGGWGQVVGRAGERDKTHMNCAKLRSSSRIRTSTDLFTSRNDEYSLGLGRLIDKSIIVIDLKCSKSIIENVNKIVFLFLS